MNPDTIRAKLNPTELEAFNEGLITAKCAVSIIEARVPDTKNHYGDYLRWIISPMHLVIFLCAGANREGVLAAARINGIQL